ncbi:hypothetical protein SF23_11565 [Streptomyces sp. MBRL 10]|nr:hypothetical protein SF23_11565 [Streptomyces sp. MBRL 10]
MPRVEPAAAQGRAVGEAAEGQGQHDPHVRQGLVGGAADDGEDTDRQVAGAVEQGGHDEEGLGPLPPRRHRGRLPRYA